MKSRPQPEAGRKKGILSSYIVMAAELAFFVFILFFLSARWEEQADLKWSFSVSANLFSMGTGIVLHYCTIRNRHFSEIRYFYLLISVVILAAGAYAIGWICDGLPGYNGLYQCSATILYISVSSITMLFYLFTVHTITGRASELKLLTAVLAVLYAAELFLIFLNISRGFYFFIDDSDVYHRGSLYFFAGIVPTGREIITTTIAAKHRLPRKEKTAVILCCVLPPVCSILSALFYGSGVVYVSIQIMLVIIYSIFFAEMDFSSTMIRSRYRNQIGSRVVPRLVDSKTGSVLKTQRQTVTILHCRMRNIDGITAERNAEETMELMNRCFCRICSIAENMDGVLIEFLNGGLSFSFGAPVPSDRHAERAVAAAIEMEREFFQNENQYEGVHLSIAVYTDNLLMGSIGNRDQLQYTTVSDAIRCCQSMEEHARDGEVLATYDTIQAVHVPLGYGPCNTYESEKRYFPVHVYSIMGIEGNYKKRMPSIT